jgi:hypothetical protein
MNLRPGITGNLHFPKPVGRVPYDVTATPRIVDVDVAQGGWGEMGESTHWQ